MTEVELGPSGRSTTQLGFGCSGLMGALDRPASLRLLEAVFAAGIRHFDVAPMYGYGEAESCLGEFLARHPGECTVTTKFGIAAPARGRGFLGPARRLAAPVLRVVPGLKRRLLRAADAVTGGVDQLPFTPETARDSLERSLRALGVERIDLWLLLVVRVADLPARENDGLLRFLEAAERDGKIGAFGIASQRSAAGALLRERPEYCHAVQTEWSLPAAPDRSTPDRFMMPARQEHGSGEPGPVAAPFRIYHRLVAEGVAPLQASLVGNPEIVKRWSSLTGEDLSNAAHLPCLLLKTACVFSPKALFLFSSKSPDHIVENVAAVSSEALRAPAQRLHALLRSEGLPKSATGDWRVA